MNLSYINECASSPALGYLNVHFDRETSHACNPIQVKSLDCLFCKKCKWTVSLCSVHIHSSNFFTILCMQVNLKNHNHSFITFQVIYCDKRQVTSLGSPYKRYMSSQAKTKRLSDS